jgi:hypothetical protein
MLDLDMTTLLILDEMIEDAEKEEKEKEDE